MGEPAVSGDKVRVGRRGGVGEIVLDRPRAINALDHDMVREIAAALLEWESDGEIRAVLVRGAGERGLCAGGDIVSIHRDATTGGVASLDFWRDEYVLNGAIARYPKPYVVFMDGIVMGGGVGISAHGDVRLVTERSVVAMPETGIGFVPDVGGTYLLARTPGEIGTHLALTGARMGAGDAIACGFADHFVHSEDLDGFAETLVEDSVDAAVARFARPAPESPLLAAREWIDPAYSASTVEEIVERLAAAPQPEARAAAEALATKSPTSLAVTLESVRRAARAESLEHVLDDEYRVSTRILGTHDLAEGIRAQVIDKDRTPRWDPATSSEVGDVSRFFVSLGDDELGLA
ncbi:enoyl-CoA hydratase/isomerase family protein [Rhodococcus rhodnii]|nr:enoyl-CoA hydratase/isomerase family protein [Rhodococcus rhodnii]TXG92819.1 enoyl-CoA hydratase/isomerase family protein [Rhodococcus rhodnii]